MTYFYCFLSLFKVFYAGFCDCIGENIPPGWDCVIVGVTFVSGLGVVKDPNVPPCEVFVFTPNPKGFDLLSEMVESFGSYLTIFVEFSVVGLKKFFC